MRRLIAQRDTDAVDRLRNPVEEESRARALQDRPTLVRLSGEFHIRLAEYAGHRMLASSMRGLATLARLAILLHGAPHATACRRAGRAAEPMLEPLNHIESSLDLKGPRDGAVDLAAVLMSR